MKQTLIKFLSLSPKQLIVGAVIFHLCAIALAHLIAPGIFDWAKDTISSLGGQHYSKSWVMQIAFLGYGLMLLTGLGSIKNKTLGDKFLMIYAVAVMMAGIFRAMPMDETLAYNNLENTFHATFAAIGGISIGCAILCNFLEDKANRWTHLTYLLVVVSLMMLYGVAKQGRLAIGRGIIQKSLFLSGSSWIFWRYKNSKAPSSS